VRVIAGTLKGRRLKTPTWSGLRPTSDKLRETLFNILAPRIADASVLDLYAGTGALGIEALSRGARSAVFVEANRRAQALIAENLARCGFENGYAIIRTTAARALEQLARSAHEPFDIVLLDPPYAPESRQGFESILAEAARMLAPTGVAILEHARRQPSPAATGSLVRLRHVVSGDSALSLYGFTS
jgi:16S rRNA (guanine(966)-N(2))-methyltransferase RsmD